MKHICKRITVLLLVFALVVIAASGIETALAVELDRRCTLTVNSGHIEDLAEAGLKVDIYQIAKAVPVSGYDSYAYEAIDPYGELNLNGVQDSETWKKLAQQAAPLAVNGGNAPICASVNSPIINLDSGLYLLLVHGAEEDVKLTRVPDDDGGEILATSVAVGMYNYSFSPVLVSLPGMDGNTGDWIYDYEITLKPQQETRLGSLTINKNLTGFVSGSPAIFVFEVEAVLDGAVVYSDVVSVTFSEAGSQSVTIDNIPVGAEVTVTEIYSGVCYRLVSGESETKNITILPDDIAQVDFTNEPVDTNTNGGGITNEFTYKQDGWHWTQIRHDL